MVSDEIWNGFTNLKFYENVIFSIPSSIEKCVSLKYIDFQRNCLIVLPPEIGIKKKQKKKGQQTKKKKRGKKKEKKQKTKKQKTQRTKHKEQATKQSEKESKRKHKARKRGKRKILFFFIFVRKLQKSRGS